ncbi:MAG: 3-oxoacyl-[acyl-carrier-protein] reductase [Dehalococcoidia bacterium]|mgnify:FL=1|nr:3-oxoacyl-[acyl-carrier-protein] reductase [Dehalococcoidia bacterium]|tara:strand:+ start:3340 stop:4083 length:744 start_codon:yes stop_codon:yes gene_type:complete
MNDKKRHALITGASRGIGAAIALELAKAGHSVSVNYNSHSDDAERVVKDLLNIGVEAKAVKGNVSDKKSVQEMIKNATDSLGPVDILVNNAGIISDNLIMRMKDEEFDKVIDTNLKGTYYCTKECIPSMVKQRWGRVINITSVVGIRGNIGQTNYSASKAAIHGFTYSLAKEVATRGVTVNAIAPGYIKTATVDVLSDKLKDHIMTWIPMKRFGTPDEISGMVAFMASDRARYMTGELVKIDGGMAI